MPAGIGFPVVGQVIITSMIASESMISGIGILTAGVRTNRYTWVEWAGGQRELYDDNADLYQLKNRGRQRRARRARRSLSQLTAMLARCTGASCRSAEQQPAS